MQVTWPNAEIVTPRAPAALGSRGGWLIFENPSEDTVFVPSSMLPEAEIYLRKEEGFRTVYRDAINMGTVMARPTWRWLLHALSRRLFMLRQGILRRLYERGVIYLACDYATEPRWYDLRPWLPRAIRPKWRGR